MPGLSFCLFPFISCSVLLFPPVNSYRRFLIHKVCESITANQPKSLSTFSIGAGDQRRTVVCCRYQLLVDIRTVSLKRCVNEVELINTFLFHAIYESLNARPIFGVVFPQSYPIRFNGHACCELKIRKFVFSICLSLFSRSEEAEFTWRYVERNSVPKHTSKQKVCRSDMGVEIPRHSIEDKSK